MEGLTDVEFMDVDTPFGKPSDTIAVGTLEGTRVAFLPRHGAGHHFNPTHIPSQANIYALKTLGVERVISVSAVGSLKEEFEPLHLVVPSQLIDRTRQRSNTFFEQDIVVHIAFADPFCPRRSRIVQQSAQELGITVHPGGTMVVMEGPAFSTRAESFMYRSWGADLIGMTALPKQTRTRSGDVLRDHGLGHRLRLLAPGRRVGLGRVGHTELGPQRGGLQGPAAQGGPETLGNQECSCASALRDAIITPKERIPDELKERLAPITAKYLVSQL